MKLNDDNDGEEISYDYYGINHIKFFLKVRITHHCSLSSKLTT